MRALPVLVGSRFGRAVAVSFVFVVCAPVLAPASEAGEYHVYSCRTPAGWVQFDTLSTGAHGRYHASYRFKFPGPVTYRFRVLCSHEADFPFLDGASNIVIVHEH